MNIINNRPERKNNNMIQLIGILIIVNSLVISAWWLGTHQTWNLGFTSIAILACLIGLALILNERALELSFGKFGMIKSAAKQATDDANAIAQLKQRVENQSATVDLVAKTAADAQKDVSRLRNVTDFSLTVQAAQNDDRQAFEKLLSILGDKSNEFRELASRAVVEIRRRYNGPISPGYLNLPLAAGKDPKKLSIFELRIAYNSTLTVYKASVVNLVQDSTIINRKEKMQFFVDILENCSSLTATFYAGQFFAELAKDPTIKWSPFNTKPLLEWWPKNKENIE